MQFYSKIIAWLTVALCLNLAGSACKHISSDLREDGESSNPHNISDPNGEDWTHSDSQSDRDGGQSNSDVDPDPRESEQEVTGSGPEDRSFEFEHSEDVGIKPRDSIPNDGALDPPKDAENPQFSSDEDGEHMRYEDEGYMVHHSCHGGECYRERVKIGKRDVYSSDSDPRTGDEDQDYSSGSQEGKNSKNKKNGKGDIRPSRSGKYGVYKKVYRNFAELKNEVETKEKQHKNAINNAVQKFAKSHASTNVKKVIKSHVGRHNKFVSDISAKQPLIGALSMPTKANQRTAPNTPDGRKIGVAKNYSRYVRAGIKNGTEKGHENSEKFLDFADEAIDVADQFFSGGYKSEGNTAVKVGLAAIDMAIDFTPGLSLGRDIASIYFGKNIITGETLSSTEISLTVAALFVPAVFSGTAKALKRSFKLVKKVAVAMRKGRNRSQMKNRLAAGFEGVEGAVKGVYAAAKKIGLKRSEDVENLSRWNKSSSSTLEESIKYHHSKHGGSRTISEYLSGAAKFDKTTATRKPLSGARPDGSVKWTTKKEFLIERNGQIVTYGTR